jgi:hypothetical protein
MKKIVLFASVIVSMVACRKDETGFMYKATHEYQDSKGKTGYTTDFFKMPCYDSTAAWNHYTQTEVYKNMSTWTDTTYIEYYCTVEEWIASGEVGLKN